VPAAPVLIGTVAAVGVLHTLVPDHWAPIAVIARQRGWSRLRTMRAAAIAGIGHVGSTLALGIVLWALGASVAAHYGHVVNVVAAVALIAFGLWFAIGGRRELRRGGHHHRHGTGDDHVHSYGNGRELPVAGEPGAPGRGEASLRTTLLLILGSSPMVEGLPAFLAASSFGVAVLATMAVAFSAATIITYVAVTAAALRGLEHASLGRFEQYGEVLSGLVVAAVGVFAFVTA